MQDNKSARGLSARDIFVVGASVLAWLVYDFFLFAVTVIAVSENWREAIGTPLWPWVGGLVAAPLILLLATGILRFRSGGVAQAGRFRRVLATVQILGAAGMAAAVCIPALLFSSYLNPTAEITIENRTQYELFVTVDDKLPYPCGDQTEYVKPNVLVVVHYRFGRPLGSDCFGHEPTDLRVTNALGTWHCTWQDAKSRAPLVITADGPGCTQTSYKPGLLRETPRTGGPPFSPPQR